MGLWIRVAVQIWGTNPTRKKWLTTRKKLAEFFELLYVLSWAVFRIRHILVRIRGSVPWFFCLLFFKGTFTSFFKDKMSWRSHKTVVFSYYFCLTHGPLLRQNISTAIIPVLYCSSDCLVIPSLSGPSCSPVFLVTAIKKFKEKKAHRTIAANFLLLKKFPSN